uniref:Integrase, catalytic region, zinc finger, CCHC-type, peptidase aspartic, catalytic n=1 Tax=Tanacetum cinerariifolium TaxID=118510 RepID=A0A6L2N573_TANCI|nr:hypothetical protein [Tanacetum cinerariifolium]
MLEKDMYDSWKSQMVLYMMNRQHGRMILESIENGPLIWPTIEENRVTRPKKYFELSATKAIQADCDYGSPYQSLQHGSHAQSLTPLLITNPSNDFQSSVHHNVCNLSSSIPQAKYDPSVHQQSDFSQPDSGLIFLVFQKGDDPIDAINHMMSFLTAVITSRYPPTNNQLRNSSNPRQQATINNGRVTVQPIQGRQNYLAAGLPPEVYALVSNHKVAKEHWEIIQLLMQGTSLTKQERECKIYDEFDKFAYKKGESLHDFYLRFSLLLNDMNIYNMKLEQFQKGDDPIDAINHMMSFLTAVITSWYPPTNNQLRNSSNPRQQATINNGRVTIALMANLSHYGSDNLAEVHNPDNVTNNVINQAVQAMPISKQSNIMNQSETKITSDSNIIPYSQYVSESQYAAIQNSNFLTQQDAIILSMIEQLKTQVVNYTKINKDKKGVNETLTAELERYKDQVRILKEGNNVDKVSDSCAQSMEIDNLKQTLS